MKISLKAFVYSAALILPALFVACGGGGDPTPPPPPPPANNTPPVSSFTAAPAGAALTPLIFDASASSDPDGDALSYTWDFGDDLRGGAKKVAHTYARGGVFTIKLTVGDGRGGTSSTERTVTVSAPPAPAKTVNVMGVIKSSIGQPLEGVTLEVVGSAITATTDTLGKASLIGVGAGNDSSYTVKLTKLGFAEQFKVLELPVVAESGYFEAKMMPRESALTLPDAAAGGTLTGKAGAKVVLPPNALVDASGNAVTGAVQVALSPVDVTKDIASFPGRFEGAAANGNQGLILSYGTVEYALSQNGKELNLAPGKQASIEIPVYATLNKNGSSVKVGDNYPLWSLNEQTGGWTQEGRGIVVASNASPSGMALRGEVTHFSWWNHDDLDRPAPPVPPATDEDLAAGNPYKPKPKCMIDTNADGIPKDMSGTGYCWYETSTDPNQTPTLLSARVRPQNLPPTLPVWGASATLPASGGQVLIMPADLDIVVNVSALGGTLVGTKTFRGAGNVEEEVVVILKPLVIGGSCSTPTAITETHLETYSLASNGQTQCFDLSAPAGFYEVKVARAAASSLTGTLKTIQPDGTVGAMAFATTLATSIVTHFADGISRIEVTAAANAPGAYRLEVKKVPNTGAPIAFDTDIDVPQVANRVDNYTFNATAGQQVSLGFAWSQGAAFSSDYPGIRKLNAANGVAPNNGVYTLQTAGIYQITVTNGTNATGAYRLRLNTVQGLITLNTLDPLTEITTSLNLGEVRRYVFNPPLTLGEVVALRLETASINASTSAYFRGFPQSGLVGNNAVGIPSGAAPSSKLSEFTFIPISTDTYWLYLDGNGNQNFNTIGQIGGQFTLGIFRPSAQALALDSSESGSINPNTFLTHRVNVPVAGSYLLRAVIAAQNTVTADIWNSDAPRIVNNTYLVNKGEFGSPLSFNGGTEIKGGLKIGNHTITVHNKRIDNNNPINTPTNYNVSLVTLENPTDVVLGAPAVSGVIDVAGERDYYRFNATVGQAFTIAATSPAFTGTIRIHKLSATKDFTTFETFNIFGGESGSAKALGTHMFTIPNVSYGGTGTYIIEIDATAAQTGAYSLALTSP